MHYIDFYLATKRDTHTDDVLTFPTNIGIVGRKVSTKIDVLNIFVSNYIVAMWTFT